MTDNMFKRLIEARLQNIIDLDKAKNKQFALKTKILNSKLQQYGRAIEEKQLEYFENMQIYDETTKAAKDHEELLEKINQEIAQLKQQIQRSKKKKKSAETSIPKSTCKLTDDDRNILIKRELKLKIVNHFTKLFLADTKSSNRLKGYVATETELIPFETRCKPSAQNAAAELWHAIGATSEHQDKWHELFFGNEPSNVNENSTF